MEHNYQELVQQTEEPSISADFESFFKETITSSKKTQLRPKTAHKIGQSQSTQHLKSRPMTAIKPKQVEMPKEYGKNSEKETRVNSSVSASVLIQ